MISKNLMTRYALATEIFNKATALFQERVDAGQNIDVGIPMQDYLLLFSKHGCHLEYNSRRYKAAEPSTIVLTALLLSLKKLNTGEKITLLLKLRQYYNCGEFASSVEGFFLLEVPAVYERAMYCLEHPGKGLSVTTMLAEKLLEDTIWN
jgi:hypothetical protein